MNVIFIPAEAPAPHSAIRQRDYKLIHDWSGRLLLHNIVHDLFEKQDLPETIPDNCRSTYNEVFSVLYSIEHSRVRPDTTGLAE